jgi:hypothetical protein
MCKRSIPYFIHIRYLANVVKLQLLYANLNIEDVGVSDSRCTSTAKDDNENVDVRGTLNLGY